MQYLIYFIVNLWVSTAWCGDFSPLKDGLDAYHLGQFRRAYAIIKPWAEKGEPQAQFTLALMYSAGQGIEIDEQRAAYWFELAANQGHRDAQFFLAQTYEYGWGINPSPNQAQEWYQRCAQQGEPRCQARFPQNNSITQSPPSENQSVTEMVKATDNSQPSSELSQAAPVVINESPVSPPSPDLPSPKFQGEDWVQMQKPTHYTLQIFTSPAEQDLRDYAKKFDLHGDLAIVPEMRQGRIWYNLLYGTYPTANAANKSRATLPVEVKRDVWVRRFGKITPAKEAQR